MDDVIVLDSDLPVAPAHTQQPTQTLSPSSLGILVPRSPAEELLAQFSPSPQPKKVISFLDSPRSQYTIAMASPRRLRAKDTVSYEESETSQPGTPGGDSPFAVGGKSRRRHIIDLELSSEEEVQEPPKTPPPRVSSAGHSLRQHAVIKQPLRAQENADKPVTSSKKKRKSYGTPRVLSDLSSKANTPRSGRPKTERAEVREAIAAETRVSRSAFFVAKKDIFLPLLPERSNHVSNLVAKSEEEGAPPLKPIAEYEELTEQPKGIKASMKPYQLSGLSFMVYLQRNGLSGILGDEMGLGKTLQTLALIQWVKEARAPLRVGSQNRPSLVICPLSVLSSWMSESKRWTPGLKVLRFHGPSKERDRLKRVALGDEDFYGNSTQHMIKKRNARLAARGKDIKHSIDLESDEDNDDGPIGVDLVVTTYETFASEQGWLKKAFVWTYVVLDEGHKVKNEKSNISNALQGLGAEFRLILTGTPLQNNLSELWALLHWLYPEVFTDKTAEAFKVSFDLTRGKVSTEFMDHARRLLELIMIRRMKSSPEVDLNLPPKTDVLLYVPLTPLQRLWYTRLLTRADQGLLDNIFSDSKAKEANELEEESQLLGWKAKSNDESGNAQQEGAIDDDFEESKAVMRQTTADKSNKSAWQKLMNLLMQLRKVCNHPYMLKDATPNPYYLGEHIVHASGKLLVLDKIINQLVLKEKRKILIFSGFTSMLDYTEDFLNIRGGDGEKFRHLRLDGQTERARRNLGIRLFNDVSTDYQVMLISTRAGGLGINLTTASDVIMLDQDWNPQVMLQAEARAHRIGQTKPVTIYKLCTSSTVEEQMMGRIQKKLYLSAKVTETMRDIYGSASKKKGRPSTGAADDDDAHQLDTTQLMSLFRRGAQAICRPELNLPEITAWTWEDMLDKCRDKSANSPNSDSTDPKAKEEEEKKWLAEIEQVETRVFQGKKFEKEQKKRDLLDVPGTSREDRRLGKNTTVMVGGFAISKESMDCGDWEAVPTLAGKDPRLAEPKREKKEQVNNQEHCQVCWDGGDVVLCSTCPRSYHVACLDKEHKVLAKGKMNYHCSQHQCADCKQKTGDAGGMLYRCRWCERGYCEDCLDFTKTKLLGDTLKEYELLEFGAVTQAYYIECPSCTEHHKDNHGEKEFCMGMAAGYDAEYEKKFRSGATTASSKTAAVIRSPSHESFQELTDAATISSSGVSTPRLASHVAPSISSIPRKRKAQRSLVQTPSKRQHQIV